MSSTMGESEPEADAPVIDDGGNPRRLRSPRARRARLPVVFGATSIALLMVVGFPGAGGTGGSPTASPAVIGTTASSAANNSSCPTLNLPTPICHVVVLYLENQNVTWVLKHAPFERWLTTKYAFAAQYYSVMHYSFPNYIAATSGVATNLIRTVPEYPNASRYDLSELLTMHSPSLTWHDYSGAEPTNCSRVSTKNYKPAHNPFVYYSEIWDNKSECKLLDVGLPTWNTTERAGATSTYSFVAPNLTDDCYAGVVSCDSWLKGWLSPVINESVFKSSVVFLTYDESTKFDNSSGIPGVKGGGHIYMAAVSPFACAGYQSTTVYNDFDLLTTTEWLLGLGHTGMNDNWTQHPPMKDLFCFPSGSGGGSGRPASTAASAIPLPALERRRSDSTPVRQIP